MPKYVSTIDEASVKTKARTRARSYMPKKPDKFAIRFYCIVEWKTLYVHSLWDSGSGNWVRHNEYERYLQVFPELRTATYDVDESRASRTPAQQLWTAMIASQTKKSINLRE